MGRMLRRTAALLRVRYGRGAALVAALVVALLFVRPWPDPGASAPRESSPALPAPAPAPAPDDSRLPVGQVSGDVRDWGAGAPAAPRHCGR